MTIQVPYIFMCESDTKGAYIHFSLDINLYTFGTRV